jgi:general secretion pathway protein G
VIHRRRKQPRPNLLFGVFGAFGGYSEGGRFTKQPFILRFKEPRMRAPASDRHCTKQVKPRARGFTLVELMVVVVIIGLLAGVGIVTYNSRLKSARKKIALANMKELENVIEMFYADQGRLPQSLQDLAVRPGWAKEWPDESYVKAIPKDPWGNDFEYRRPGANNRKYDLVCLGADGAQGGSGDDADIMLYDNENPQ